MKENINTHDGKKYDGEFVCPFCFSGSHPHNSIEQGSAWLLSRMGDSVRLKCGVCRYIFMVRSASSSAGTFPTAGGPE